jgi:hypothetical protein
VIIISQCGFISSNTFTTLVGVVENGRVNVHFGVGEDEKSLYNSPILLSREKCSKIKIYSNNQKLNKRRKATSGFFKWANLR